MAHDATMLGIPVDTGRLFDGDDPDYELWLGLLIDRVYATKRREHREAEKKMKR